jgi:hypothetical protein
MCLFIVVDADATGRMLVLFDTYDKCHLVRIAGPSVAAIGHELHGPRAAMGLHFLVLGHTGQRLDGHFEALGVDRHAVHAEWHPPVAPLEPVKSPRPDTLAHEAALPRPRLPARRKAGHRVWLSSSLSGPA